MRSSTEAFGQSDSPVVLLDFGFHWSSVLGISFKFETNLLCLAIDCLSKSSGAVAWNLCKSACLKVQPFQTTRRATQHCSRQLIYLGDE